MFQESSDNQQHRHQGIGMSSSSNSTYTTSPVVDLASSSSSTSTGGDSSYFHPVSPDVIFREPTDIDFAAAAGGGSSDLSVPSCLIRRANPIIEKSREVIEEEGDYEDDEEQGEGYRWDRDCADEDEDGSGRAISPYPFHLASPGEIEEREHLMLKGSSAGWNQEPREDSGREEGDDEDHSSVGVRPDYSRFFEMEPYYSQQQQQQHQNQQGVGLVNVMDCDDFSLSSHEACSITESFSFGGLTQDANQFWEGVLDQAAAGGAHNHGGNDDDEQAGRASPAQVSLLSADLHFDD